MYHNIILNDILDLCNLAQVYEIVHLRKRLNIWTAKIYKMLEFSSAMSHPDGNISFLMTQRLVFRLRILNLCFMLKVYLILTKAT